MNREEITNKIKENLYKIKDLEKENDDLMKQGLLLSDEKQQFTEEKESHPKKPRQKHPNWLDGRLVGRIHWKEELKDEDTGETITVNRERIVRVDGKWTF